MISLNKFIGGTWERARNSLREDLETIEVVLNQRWAAVFGDSNQLKSGTISGPSTLATRYVANTGVANAPKWDQVDLSNGVKGILPVQNGGTLTGTLTAHGVLIGEGTAAVVATAPGGIGQVLVGAGASVDPSFQVFSIANLWSM